MTIVIGWILFAIAVGIFANRRGRSGFGWWLLALAISPLIAGVFVAVLPDLAILRQAEQAAEELARTHVQCRFCAEPIRRDAILCRFCGKEQKLPPGIVRITTTERLIGPQEEAIPAAYEPCAILTPAEVRAQLHAARTSEFQAELETIVGGREEDSAHFSTSAFLIAEGADSQEVRVEIEGHLVGYLGERAADSFLDTFWKSRFATARCDAMIVGGWRREDGDGLFGVRLSAALPFSFENADDGAIQPAPRQAVAEKADDGSREFRIVIASFAAVIAVGVVVLAIAVAVNDKPAKPEPIPWDFGPEKTQATPIQPQSVALPKNDFPPLPRPRPAR